MKKTFIAASAALALSAMASASAVTFVDLNLSAFDKPSTVSTTTVIIPGNDCGGDCSGSPSSSSTITSVHEHEARNVGLGLEFQTESRAATALVGFNLGNWNEYLAAEYAPINVGERDRNFSAGLIGAVAHTDSIGNYPTGGVFVSMNRNKYGVNLIATPNVNNVPAFVGLQLRYRLGDEPKAAIVPVVFTPAPKPTPYVAPAPAPAPKVVPAPVVEEVIIKHGKE